ncbi:MAG: hypothetical protein PHR41_09350 [Lactococcus chungangensis]|nr:hypothetical protein [Lactococcus chungangensis]
MSVPFVITGIDTDFTVDLPVDSLPNALPEEEETVVPEYGEQFETLLTQQEQLIAEVHQCYLWLYACVTIVVIVLALSLIYKALYSLTKYF